MDGWQSDLHKYRFCASNDSIIEEAIQESLLTMHSLVLLEDKQNYEEYLRSIKGERTLLLKADFVTPTNLLEVLLNKGANDAVNVIRRANIRLFGTCAKASWIWCISLLMLGRHVMA